MNPQEIVKTLLQHRPKLIGYAITILRNAADADDVFQDVCLRAMDADQPFQSDTHLVHWAMRVARNLAIDQLRRADRTTQRLDDTVLAAIEREFVDTKTIDRDLEAALEHCTRRLTDRQRELIDLRYRRGLAGADIAIATGRSRDAIYKSLARVHDALFDCITQFMQSLTGGPRHD